MASYIRIAVFALQYVALFIAFLASFSTLYPFHALIGHFGLTMAMAGAMFPLLCVCLAIPYMTRALLGSSAVIRRYDKILETWLASCATQLEAWVKELSPTQVRAAIIVTAGLTLFLELVLVRWEASSFVVFSLYKNLALLSCFCGLGLGYALARETKLLLAASLPMLVALLLAFTIMHYGLSSNGLRLLQVVPILEEANTFFTLQDLNVFDRILTSVPVYMLLAGTFIMNVLVLLPVGQFCGRLMQQSRPLASYGYNLLGSIVGVVLLFFLSWLWGPPVLWFGIAAAILAWYLMALPAARRAALCSAALCVIITAWPVQPMIQSIYSPYQLIEKSTQRNGMMLILASGSYYQKVYDLNIANANREADPDVRKVLGYYDLPFRTAPSLTHVAIVGAGAGNDVAAALRNGASSVDAVEIDPAIIDLGLHNHPEHPYQSLRTRAIINDARSFFRTTTAQYDAIVYGVLDSHIVLSHGGNLRVDSFVYTREGLRDAFVHLKDGGLMSVAFAMPNRLMGEKIFRILGELLGASPPVAVLTGYDNKHTTTFMVSKGGAVHLPLDFMKTHQLEDVTRDYVASSNAALDLPTDDWPFFYMDAKMYPATYVIALGLMLVLAFILVRSLLPTGRWDRSFAPFFFLGGGFMLVETKAITELSLLFGNTWQVIGITVVSVLVMAYLANLFAARLKRPVVTLGYVGLLAAIAAGYAVVKCSGINMPGLPEKIGMVVLLTCPLFFSGLVFSTLLKKTNDLCGAMAYNLMGGMLGGALEYNAMQFGFASLYLIAFALYALAWLTARRPATAGQLNS